MRWLSDHPDTAAWLTPDERDALNHTLSSAPLSLRPAPYEPNAVHFLQVRERSPASWLDAMADARVLILAAIQFGFTLASYGISIFLPLILKEYQLSNWAIGWIAAIPYLFASAGMILWARYVDQKGRRIVNLAIACLLGGAGLVAPIDPRSGAGPHFMSG